MSRFSPVNGRMLPLRLGTNGGMLDYGIDWAGIAYAQAAGISVYRNDVPWNFAKGAFPGLESAPGARNAASVNTLINVAQTLQAAGLTPLFVITVSKAPALDATWTPQALADLMVYLVSQPGLAGLHWELFNEPDGVTWGAPAALVTQTYQLAYGAMKAADPTCVVHGICIENLAPPGYPEGTTYYNASVAAGILGHYDVLSFHQYGVSPTNTLDCSPDAPNIYGQTFTRMIANFRANMIAKGDTSSLWMTEFGWQSSGGAMTPQLQAQYYQALLTELAGTDPVNRVPYSSYLAAACQFKLTGSFQNWSVIDPVTGPKPAYQALGQLVAGR